MGSLRQTSRQRRDHPPAGQRRARLQQARPDIRGKPRLVVRLFIGAGFLAMRYALFSRRRSPRLFGGPSRDRHPPEQRIDHCPHPRPPPRGEGRLVPVIALAIWERLPKVWPFQAKPSSRIMTRSSRRAASGRSETRSRRAASSAASSRRERSGSRRSGCGCSPK
jgi:hypothetical protein